MDEIAQAIVSETVALRGSHPNVPAIEVLDLVLTRRLQSSPDFARLTCSSENCLDLPHPFAETLRQAFAPGLVGVDLGPTSSANYESQKIFVERWIEVIDCFVKRYRLWGSS